MTDCRKIKLLSTFYLDKELTASEEQMLSEHLEVCADCASEYEQLRVLQAGFANLRQQKHQAPKDFTAKVMAAVKVEKQASKARKVPWKHKFFSGVAAAALLAFAVASPWTDDTPGRGDVAFDWSKISTGLMTQLEQIEAKGSGSVQLAEQNPIERATFAKSPADKKQQTGTEADVTVSLPEQTVKKAASSTSTTIELAPVLMNKNQVVNSTLWKMKLNNFDVDFAKIAGICKGAGATYKNMGDMVADGNQYTVVKVTANKSSSADLVNKLAGLGVTLSKQTETKDLSAVYSEQLDQFMSLGQQYEQSQNEQEKSNLKEQMDKIEKQLRAWQEEAGKETLVLWLAR